MLFAFDEIRAQAKDNLAEPGFRPGEIPPWIKTQMVEFSLTSVMEDVLKHGVECDGMSILDDAGNGEDMIRWDEEPVTPIAGYHGTCRPPAGPWAPTWVRRAPNPGVVAVQKLSSRNLLAFPSRLLVAAIISPLTAPRECATRTGTLRGGAGRRLRRRPGRYVVPRAAAAAVASDPFPQPVYFDSENPCGL